MVAAEQEVCERARQLRLADTRRPQEDEAADRTVRVLETGPRAPDGPRDRRDRLLLADDTLVEAGPHAEQLVALVLVDRGHRDAGPLRHDLLHVGLSHDHPAAARLCV